MTRPAGLPDFTNPPLNEVVLGVQFAPAVGYQQILAGKVWDLFRDDFPVVEEQLPLPPTFETFGQPLAQTFNFGLVTGAQHDRFWFLAQNGDELLQFQHDKFLHNWRKIGDQTNEYPRFEGMIRKFDDEIVKLNIFMKSLSGTDLQINQCELSYVNHIQVDGDPNIEALSRIVRFVNPLNFDTSDARVFFRRNVQGMDGTPIGRLICEIAPTLSVAGKPIFVMALHARGLPASGRREDAIDFLTKAREMIVNLFAEITTDSAQRTWGRLV